MVAFTQLDAVRTGKVQVSPICGRKSAAPGNDPKTHGILHPGYGSNTRGQPHFVVSPCSGSKTGLTGQQQPQPGSHGIRNS
jgi:hypothetical protein